MSFFWNILPALIFLTSFGAWWAYSSYKENQDLERFNREFNLTLAELEEFNGTTRNWIFVAVKDEIFDVTDAPFYGPGMAYNIFAGKDASVSLAKNDLQGQFLNRYGTIELNENEEQALEDWYQTFKSKYRVAGKVVRKK